MSNIRKTFNFRDGVQVDDDDLVVRGGKVGIGNTIPTLKLDVNGDIRSVGVVTSTDLFVTGVSTTTELRVGGNISASASSGVITATAFYGNGATLSNLPTSQWVDIDVGLGFTSIYAAGNVGVGTTDPRSTFQVGANPNASGRGVGFNSTGDIRASGVVTAYAFVGFGTDITNLNADNITNGTILNTFLPTIDNAKLPSNISVSGVVTATSGFVGSLTGNVTGNLTGIAQSASSLTGTPNINVGVITATRIITDTIEVIQSPVGVTTIANTLNVGTGGTGFTATNAGRIGVGTANPSSDVQVRKNGTTTVEVLSNTGEARISIGQSVGVGNSTAVLRFGNSQSTFDIINRATGSFNQYIHAGSSGVGTGNFNWLYGQTNDELMTLTYDGKLGVGITNPTETFEVVGTSTVTGNANFGANVTVVGNLNVGNLTLPPILSNTNLNNSTGISTFNDIEVLGNLVLTSAASSIGMGTDSPTVALDVRNGTGFFQSVGVGTDIVGVDNVCVINGSIGITTTGYIGIGTTAPVDLTPNTEFGQIQLYTRTIDMINSLLNVKNDGAIGFNTYIARSVFDYGRVGSATTNPYMILPNVTTAVRAGLAQTVEGAIIYNSTTKKHQGYGSTDGGTTFGWNDLY